MKLIGYEIRKVCMNKFWLMALLALLILDAVLILEPWQGASSFSTGMRHRQEQPFLKFIDRADAEEYEEYIESITGLLEDGWQTAEDFFNVPEDPRPGRYLPTVGMELNVLTGPLRTLQYIIYPNVLEQRADIVAMARKLGKTALEENDEYGIRLNMNIINRYSKRPATIPQNAVSGEEGHFSVYGTKGWERFFSYQWGDLFALFIIVLISAAIFSQERKAARLLFTTRFGRRRTQFAKMMTAVLYALLISLLFSGLQFILISIKYGLGGADASVLSIYESMGTSPWNTTLGQTALIFTLFRAFGAVCAAMVTALLSYLASNTLAAYLGSVIWLGASCGYYLVVGKNAGFWLGFRLLPDITLWTRPMWMFQEYRVANVFSFPVLWAWVCAVFWFLLCAGILIFVMWSSENKKQVNA